MSQNDRQHQNERVEGAWIFVSHSSRDFQKVRAIRNALERHGHKPLLFFLKCLEGDDAKLPDILKSEIAARQWFILCDSPNARESHWVQEEMAIIKSLMDTPCPPGKEKIAREIDLSKPIDDEIHKLIELSKRATVFLSFARADIERVRPVQQALLESDYRVWDETAISAAAPFTAKIASAIEEAAKEGFVLVFMSPAYFASAFCGLELQEALKRAAQLPRTNIIPILIEPVQQATLPPELQSIQWFDFTVGRLEDRIAELIRTMKTREME